MISLKLFAEKLKREKAVAIFIHVRPDGDTVGSGLALWSALNNIGVEADIFSNDAIPQNFSFIEETKFVKYDIDLSKGYSAFVLVDVADANRIGKFFEIYTSSKNTYNIDHHVSNTMHGAFNYVVDKASNCENVMDLIMELNAPITERIANLLALGMVTDTGNFTHKNVTQETFYKAGVLQGKNANFNQIYYNTFIKQTKSRAKLFGLTMSKIRYLLNDRFAVITVRREDLILSGAKPEQTEGFIDFVMGIDSVEVGACLLELEEKKYKISLRSKKADVNAVATSFGGGGHVLASGCQISADYEEIIDKLSYRVSQQLED